MNVKSPASIIIYSNLQYLGGESFFSKHSGFWILVHFKYSSVSSYLFMIQIESFGFELKIRIRRYNYLKEE